jgi:hypothetical protein
VDWAYYTADVLSAHDQYAFGQDMEERSFERAPEKGYRYGMNGQEKDDDVASGVFAAQYWEYDSRIGRRWNVDPKPNVSESLYACFGNNPIAQSDVLGDTIVRDNKSNTGVLVMPRGYEKDEGLVVQYNAAVKSKLSIIVAGDLEEMVRDLKKTNHKFKNVLIGGHSGADDNTYVAIAGYSYNSSELKARKKELASLGKHIKLNGNLILLGCFEGAQYLKKNNFPILEELHLLIHHPVIANQGETPLCPDTFDGAPLSMDGNPKAPYYKMNEAGKGHWIKTSARRTNKNQKPAVSCRDIGNIKLDTNGEPSKAPSKAKYRDIGH